jgi:DNA-binding NarL/FixJ family response regulator
MRPQTREGGQHMAIDDLRKKHVYIIGPLKLQNFALAYYLREVLGVECTELTAEDTLTLPKGAQDRNSVLFLIDCIDVDLEKRLSVFGKDIRNVIHNFLVCIFNIRPDQKMAEETLNQQVQGIFYIDDDARNLDRGIKAVFDGELWIPRRIMTSLIQNYVTEPEVGEVDQDILTPREIEILYLIVMGNDQSVIGEKLFISPHTVKTHLSNIFRTIGLKNQLQAKAWFEKNRAALRPETK